VDSKSVEQRQGSEPGAVLVTMVAMGTADPAQDSKPALEVQKV